MKILYLGYWSVNDGLSQSTIVPHLKILAGLEEVEAIYYISLERGDKPQSIDISKVRHIPFTLSGGIVTRGYQELKILPKWLAGLVRQKNIGLIICRGAPAGAIGYLLHQQTAVPYVVESFEPHAAYMRESGVWEWWNPKYLLANWFGEKQKKTASFLLPVTENYKRQLLREGLPAENILVSPCAVDMKSFCFSKTARQTVRQLIGWDSDAIVGVYLGKFGGIYYDAEAFEIFRYARELISDFRLLIISPDTGAHNEARLLNAGFTPQEYHICRLPYQEIPSYLSAADFAFSTVKAATSRKYCSPVKNGEYWANGLPIFLTRGVGDDSDIIQAEGGGVLFSVPDVREPLKKMTELIGEKKERSARIPALAEKYRSFNTIAANYAKILDRHTT